MIGPSDREGGFIVLLRRIQSSPLFESFTAEQWAVAVRMLLLANWAPSQVWNAGAWHRIERGELIHSLATIADKAKVGVQVVRSTIAKMKADDSGAGGRGPFLSERWTGTTANSGLRVLTILRYSEYQDVPGASNTDSNEAPTRCQHAANTAPTPSEPDQPEEPDQPTQEAFAGAVAPPAQVQGQDKAQGHPKKPRKPRTPSAQERIGRALNDTRLKVHPNLEPWPVESKRFIQVVNSNFAAGRPFREAWERLGSATCLRAFELYLAEAYWGEHGSWPLRAFLADDKWREFLDAAKDAVAAPLAPVSPDAYWQQELAALTPEEREEAIRAHAEQGVARA